MDIPTQVADITINAGPRDPKWIDRLKEEYTILIKYI